MMDAYTIRKVLPRLLVAVIFINLSWPVLQYLVELTNIVGIDIRSIIYTPFNSIGKGGVVTISGGASSVGALIGGSAFALGLIGVGGLVTMAFLAVAVGFILLLLRQVVIMMLIVSAPLAIACYVLPATEKFWKIWRDTLISMLVVFPIISAFIAMGRVGAVVMYNASMYSMPAFTAIGQMFGVPMHTATLQSLPPLVKQLGAATLWFLSLPIAIVLGWKASGRTTALLHGAVSGKVKSGLGGAGKGGKPRKQGGWRDRLKGKLQRGDFQGVRFIPGSGRAARAFGRVTAGASLGVKGRFGLPTAQGRAAIFASRDAASLDVMKHPKWTSFKDNDDATFVASNYATAEEAARGLQGMAGWGGAANADRRRDAIAAVQRSIGFGRAQQLAAYRAYVDTGTAPTNAEEAVRTAVAASGGNRSALAANIGYLQAVAKTKGRQDLSGGYGNGTNDGRMMYAARRLQDGQDVGQGIFDAITVSGMSENGAPTQTFGTAKPRAVGNFAAAQSRLTLASGSGAPVAAGTAIRADYFDGLSPTNPNQLREAYQNGDLLVDELVEANYSAGSGEGSAIINNLDEIKSGRAATGTAPSDRPARTWL
jgi:hypothetical protein